MSAQRVTPTDRNVRRWLPHEFVYGPGWRLIDGAGRVWGTVEPTITRLWRVPSPVSHVPLKSEGLAKAAVEKWLADRARTAPSL